MVAHETRATTKLIKEAGGGWRSLGLGKRPGVVWEWSGEEGGEEKGPRGGWCFFSRLGVEQSPSRMYSVPWGSTRGLAKDCRVFGHSNHSLSNTVSKQPQYVVPISIHCYGVPIYLAQARVPTLAWC